MKGKWGQMVLVVVAAVLGFLGAYGSLVVKGQNITFNSDLVFQMILTASILIYVVLIVMFAVTLKQIKTEQTMVDDDEKEEFVSRKVTNLIGYSAFMQLLSFLAFALTMIHVANSDTLAELYLLVGSLVLIWVSSLFSRKSLKENNHYLPDLKYFYQKNESITDYVDRLDEAQKFYVYKYCFSIVEKMKSLFMIAFAVVLLLTVSFSLSIHLLLGVMALWCVFQFIIIRESKKVRM